MKKFQQIAIEVTPLARVRIVQQESKYGHGFHGWEVQYLPKGKRNWWWNWQAEGHYDTEAQAREKADELVAAGSMIRNCYKVTELELP